MTHLEILKMIEEVSPYDTAKLDHIDVLFFEYKTGVSPSVETVKFCGDVEQRKANNIPQYTRSRDALKAARPKPNGEWWSWTIRAYGGFVKKYCDFTRSCDFGSRTTPALPTEELAELHAIVQAIAWEREHAL